MIPAMALALNPLRQRRSDAASLRFSGAISLPAFVNSVIYFSTLRSAKNLWSAPEPVPALAAARRTRSEVFAV